MEKIVRVKFGGHREFVLDFEEVHVVLERAYNGVIRYELRGFRVLPCSGMLDSVPIMDGSCCERLMDIAEYLMDMRSEARPDLAPIDCSAGSDIDSLVRDHMAKRSRPVQEGL